MQGDEYRLYCTVHLLPSASEELNWVWFSYLLCVLQQRFCSTVQLETTAVLLRFPFLQPSCCCFCNSQSFHRVSTIYYMLLHNPKMYTVYLCY